MSQTKFFVPFLDEGEETNTWYTLNKNLLDNEYDLLDKRVYSFSSTHNGSKFTDTVGEENVHTKKTVLAIFETDSMFLTLVEGRILQPLLASKSNSEPVYFDNE